MKRFSFLPAIFLLVSCNFQFPFSKTECVTFSLPESEEELLLNEGIFLSFWKIEIITSSSSSTQIIPGNQKSFSHEFEKNIPCSVLCTPLFSTKSINENPEKTFEFLYPAGTIYPFEKNIRWEGGFCAEILKNFIIQEKKSKSDEKIKKNLLYFNWSRFIKSVDEKSAEENYVPWLTESEKIISAISEGKFSVTLLNMKNFSTFSENELLKNENARLFSKYAKENSTNSKRSQKFYSIKKEKNSVLLEKKDGIFEFLIINNGKSSIISLANSKITI